MALCPHCLEKLKDDAQRCPNCGLDPKDYLQNSSFLPVGTSVEGSNGHTFVIGKVIGRGGFGITYVGRELSSGRLVAIKEYFPVECQAVRQGRAIKVDDKQTNRDVYNHGLRSFLSEASMLKAVSDIPSIVHVLDFFELNNTAYMVMDYLGGETLASIVRRSGPMPFSFLLPRLRVLMADLGRLHDAGVLHRDISPDNIMLMPDGSLRILDFGCARSMEDGRAMTVFVKKGFAPIEQYQHNGRQGPFSDIYALCASIYYCITKTLPTDTPSRVLAYSEGEELLKKPSELGAQISPENEQALMWGLALKAESRPANMGILAARFKDEAPAEAVRPPEPQVNPAFIYQPTRKPAQKSGGDIALIIIIFILLLIAAALFGVLVFLGIPLRPLNPEAAFGAVRTGLGAVFGRGL